MKGATRRYDTKQRGFEKIGGSWRRGIGGKKWLKHKCNHCGYTIEYHPNDDWKGDLRCPDCGKTTSVPLLDAFFGVKKNE